MGLFKNLRQQVQGAAQMAAEIPAWVNWKVAVLLEPGLEVPVELDRATGMITGLGTGQLADEVAARSKEAKRRHKGNDVDTGVEGITGFSRADPRCVRLAARR